LTRGIAVDANVMNLFSRSLIRQEETNARTIVERIESTHGFAIDAGGKIKHQWLETCDKVYFGTWFVEALKAGRIREVVAKLPRQHEKHLRIRCGMPTGRAELTYVAVSNAVVLPRHIVTEDIDFWEPSAKAADEKTKQDFKNGRTGCVCRYLRLIGVTVATIQQALGEL
jgi:hypothetical protein